MADAKKKGGMAQRGVTRPMAMHAGHGPGDEEGSGHGTPYSPQRYQMLRMYHRQTLWVYWTLILLGLWTVLAPFNFGYLNESLWVDPSGGRGVWFSETTHTALRAWLMTWSGTLIASLVGLITCLAVVALAIPRGPVKASCGLWNHFVL